LSIQGFKNIGRYIVDEGKVRHESRRSI
jgi:hypothetical protein